MAKQWTFVGISSTPYSVIGTRLSLRSTHIKYWTVCTEYKGARIGSSDMYDNSLTGQRGKWRTTERKLDINMCFDRRNPG